MKRIIITVAAVVMAVVMASCASPTAKKAIEQSKLSMASADYTAALNYLQLAQQEGGDSEEVQEMVAILQNYIKAQDEFSKLNMDGASEALGLIPESYKNYTISSDVDKLKEDVASKKSSMGDVDTQIAAVKKFIADGDYASAEANITELYTKDITNYQRKQIDELRDTINSANSKIKEAENKKPEVVYVPQTSTNTNVVATYYVVNCKEWITLRSTPSTNGADLAHIPLGQAVGFIENAGNGFYKINYDGRVGYALASYLSASKPAGSAQSSSSRRTAQVVNCDEWITLRATPSTNGADLAHIPLGAYVTYISTAENGFYCIEYNGQRGYALQSYLALK